MDNHRLELKLLLARQASRSAKDVRRSFGESSHYLLESHRLNEEQILYKKQFERIDELSSPFVGYKDVASNFHESPVKSNEDPALYGPLKEYSRNFTLLLTNPTFSGVQIKCGDETMKVHKNILASRSPVFNAMFSNSMEENITGVVKIDDLDPQIVRDLLTFIYSNKVENLTLMKALDLLEASTKYQVLSLKDICVDFVSSSLSVENAFMILQKADLYDENLKKRVISYISDVFLDLRFMEEWTMIQVNNPVLALEVCNSVIDKLAAKC